jgi:tetratricopeptide (TPR) repeat protein
MSLLKRLFSTSPEGLEKKADTLFADGRHGQAKLAYEKALEASSEGERVRLLDKVRRCRDEIARRRIEGAKAHLAQGSVKLAEQELQSALEIAHDDAVCGQIRTLLDGLEAQDAQGRAASAEMTDEERIALIVGQWHEAQAEEYDSYGEDLLDALVAMDKERFDDARARLESLVATAPEPRYLWLEIGRARLLTDDVAGGKEALQRFLGALEADEAGETKLAANLALARLADEAGEFQEAIGYFEGAVHAMPEDYRPYLAMGAFLRVKGHGAEALEVLLTALDLSKTAGTDWRLLEEIGLASELAGKTEDSRSFLEQVIELFRNHKNLDFPPATATALAKLYEAEGRLERAADMYRALSQGSDKERHALYHYEAGRLLHALGLTEEARRMLVRADALRAEDDAEFEERIAALVRA